MQDFDFSKIRYRYRPIRKPKTKRDIHAIGFDTEADRSGKTFLYCLSTGESYTPDTLLEGLFDREHRGKTYVVYNLKYEQGAILQNLSHEALDIIRKEGKVTVGDYTFRVVGYKMLRISRGKNSVTFWDMFSFFNMSLASAARQFTSLKKMDINVELFTPEYIEANIKRITRYCIRDAQITTALFDVLKGMCNRLGISPTTFYSIATIGYKYARENCNYVTVQRLWKSHRDVLEAACKAYSGGKFEITTRGKGHFYEYDINSAYPYELANLVDISKTRVVHTKTYRPGAIYGFLHIDAWLPGDESHPVPIKRGNVNIFPSGHFRRWVGKASYEFLRDLPGSKIKIIRAIWLYPRYKRKPYHSLIHKLFRIKAEAKRTGDKELYFFTWKLTNSLYGKQVQLIRKGDIIEASTCWNPVYGAIITENVRIRVARLQLEHPEIVAVHTDSVMSTKKLPLKCSDKMGDWSLKEYGLGIILGCGFYQIADKVRVRGFPSQTNLFELLNKSPPEIRIPDKRAITWKMVTANHWDGDMINRFIDIEKVLNINFDHKRIWSDTWIDGNDACDKVLTSMPLIVF
jgi:hypothetical protein